MALGYKSQSRFVYSLSPQKYTFADSQIVDKMAFGFASQAIYILSYRFDI